MSAAIEAATPQGTTSSPTKQDKDPLPDEEPSPGRTGRSSRERATSQQRSTSDDAIDKDPAQSTAKLSTKKKEALGQVPCKFFRSNGCSAGSSCPFAHTLPGDGQQKSVCQWFLKGNCRFGHKCALAHVLPGQPMSMDRKNKRAAQHGQPLPQMPSSTKSGQQQQQGQPEEAQQGQPQMRARATSFSGRDHDFPFGLPDDLQAMSPPSSATRPDTFSNKPRDSTNTLQQHASLLSKLTSSGSFNSAQRPLSVPRAPSLSAGLSAERGGMSFDGFAVGSPPSSRAFGTSPFSHPGGHSLFFSASQDSEGGAGPLARHRDPTFGARSMGRMDDAATKNKWFNSLASDGAEEELDEGQDTAAEDFVPSSLSDLLTPAELERRRRNSRMSASLGVGKEDRVTPQSMPGNSVFDLNLRNGWLPIGAERIAREPTRTSNISTGFLQRKETSGYQPFGEGRYSSGLDGIALREADGVSQSPNSRAAMHHAPGQSLPQGLAAGLSRLHLGADGSASGQPAGGNASSFGQASHSAGLQVPGSMGDYDLGPTAPSSVLAHRSPLAMAAGGGRMSGALNGGGGLGSPGAIGWGSPGRRVSDTGEGLAIPSSGEGKPQPQPVGSFGTRYALQRVRASSSAVAPHSPLTLPVMTREEDEEEAIFELE